MDNFKSYRKPEKIMKVTKRIITEYASRDENSLQTVTVKATQKYCVDHAIQIDPPRKCCLYVILTFLACSVPTILVDNSILSQYMFKGISFNAV